MITNEQENVHKCHIYGIFLVANFFYIEASRYPYYMRPCLQRNSSQAFFCLQYLRKKRLPRKKGLGKSRPLYDSAIQQAAYGRFNRS
jgi:hypothetical protein